MKDHFSKIVLLCLIILITSFTYRDVLQHQFLNFDDDSFVTENYHVTDGLNMKAIKWAFSFHGVSYWHPLTWISHMTDCHFFGLSSGAHHLASLIFHILNASLLFLIMLKMTGAKYKSAAVALLFAIHPLNVESVSWVAERKTVLSVFFLMVAILIYVFYAEKKRLWKYCLVIFSFTLGLMSKPGILSFPFLLMLLDYWPLKRYVNCGVDLHIGQSAEPLCRRIQSFYNINKSVILILALEKIPLILLSLISSYISMLSMLKYDIVINYEKIPLDIRVYNLFVTIVKYLKNVVWPFELSIFYPFPKTIPFTHIITAIFAVFIVTLMVCLFRKGRPWLLVGWFWFLFALIPAGGLIQAGLWPEMASRFMYVPMIGLFLMLVWEFDSRIRGRFSITTKMILIVLLVGYFASVTTIQNIYYSNSLSVFMRAKDITKDNYVAYNNIGHALVALNRIEESKEYFLKAISINPQYNNSLNNYGLYLQEKGDYAESSKYFAKIIDINPINVAAYINLGWSRYKMGHSLEAQMLLDKALDLDPDNVIALNRKGYILSEKGKIEDAMQCFEAAIRVNPKDVKARINIAMSYEKLGNYEMTLKEYYRIIHNKNQDTGVIYYLIAGVKSLQNKHAECRHYLMLALEQRFDALAQMKADERFLSFRKSSEYRSWVKQMSEINKRSQ